MQSDSTMMVTVMQSQAVAQSWPRRLSERHAAGEGVGRRSYGTAGERVFLCSCNRSGRRGSCAHPARRDGSWTLGRRCRCPLANAQRHRQPSSPRSPPPTAAPSGGRDCGAKLLVPRRLCVPVGATARSSTVGTRRRCLQVVVRRRACRWSLTRRNAVAMLWLGAEAAPAPPC